MSPTFASLLAACFGISVALIGLAAGLGAAATVQRAATGRGALALATVLLACGLWWPGHVLDVGAPDLHGTGAAATAHWLGTSLAAGLVVAAGAMWNRRRFTGFAGAAALLPIALFAPLAFGNSELLRVVHLQGAPVAAAWVLLLGAALLLAPLRLDQTARGRGAIGVRRARWARALACAVAAAIVCLRSAMSLPAGAGASHAAPRVVLDAVSATEWLLIAGLIGASALLLAVLRRPLAAAPPSCPPRPERSVAVDNLTGLPTRLEFEDKLRSAARRCEAKGRCMALFFVDLDGFKPVNDTFGHSSGDRVLEQVGQRMKTVARGAAFAARIGGDEFVLLAPDMPAKASATTLAQRLIEALSQPYRIDGREVAISCSVGIAMYPDNCKPEKLIARADAAMYAAKRAGGGRQCFYAPEMDVDVQQNFDLLRDLRLALAKEELELFFQPKIDARSGKVTGAEALLRWNHPSRGLVMPGQFIALAERSGLIGPLGNWVIEAACRQSRAWRDKGLRMRIAVNLSAHQMRQDDIADRIADALARHRIHPSLLTCEITESAAMEDTGATQQTFRRLGDLGTHLSIDDFGTGYSSLAYLRKLPAEELKIDASFVQDLDHSPDARAVVDAVVKLAHALGLKVVAEGVETPRQRQILAELGCDELQGYLFARPMSARALLLWAIDDGSRDGFNESLFGETRAVSSRIGLPAEAPQGG